MILHYQNGVYWLESSYEDKDVPKAAGFYWHGRECRSFCRACPAGIARGVWFTPNDTTARKLAEYADDSAGISLERLEKTLESSRALDADLYVPLAKGLALLPFQRAGIAYAKERVNVLFGDDMGLGKTVQALVTLGLTVGWENLHDADWRALVICPASLRLNWAHEAFKWLGIDSRLLHSKTFPQTIRGGLTITSYETAKLFYAELMGARGDLKASDRWDVLIADEAHYLKNPKSARTKAVFGVKDRRNQHLPGLINCAKKTLLLTGTPLPNRPIELWPLLHALAPSTFTNFMGFAKRYCNAHQETIYVKGGGGLARTVWRFDGSSNLGELQDKMRSTCMVRRLKADVLTDLPAKRRQIVALEVNGARKWIDKELAAYDMWENQVAELKSRRVAFEDYANARKQVGLAKCKHVIEHVRNILEEGVQKVILFAHHHEVIDALRDGLKDDYVVVTLDGRNDEHQRDWAVQGFQSNPDIRVFIGSIGAAGVGLTLTAASTVVFAELDPVPGNMLQAEDRAHRIGQHQSVLVQHIVYDGSVDARIAKLLVEKEEVARAALDARV